jgi:hypothetical protein
MGSIQTSSLEALPFYRGMETTDRTEEDMPIRMNVVFSMLKSAATGRLFRRRLDFFLGRFVVKKFLLFGFQERETNRTAQSLPKILCGNSPLGEGCLQILFRQRSHHCAGGPHAIPLT